MAAGCVGAGSVGSAECAVCAVFVVAVGVVWFGCSAVPGTGISWALHMLRQIAAVQTHYRASARAVAHHHPTDQVALHPCIACGWVGSVWGW